jgi:hypothetical protein
MQAGLPYYPGEYAPAAGASGAEFQSVEPIAAQFIQSASSGGFFFGI